MFYDSLDQTIISGYQAISPIRRVCFVVHADPKSKGRPRFAHGRAYTPKATQDAEAVIRDAYLNATKMRDGYKFTGPLGVHIRFIAGTRHRKDIDNMVKLVLDALNGVAYEDDYLIQELTAEKYISTEEKPHTQVYLYEVVPQ